MAWILPYNPKGKFKNNLNEEKGSIICENGTPLIDYVYNKQEIHIIKDGGSLFIGMILLIITINN